MHKTQTNDDGQLVLLSVAFQCSVAHLVSFNPKSSGLRVVFIVNETHSVKNTQVPNFVRSRCNTIIHARSYSLEFPVFAITYRTQFPSQDP
jgi:hypothetical protein